MIEDVLVTLGLLITAYLVWEFQKGWVGNEYQSTTFLKLNEKKPPQSSDWPSSTTISRATTSERKTGTLIQTRKTSLKKKAFS